MARIRLTYYKNSFLATLVNLIATLFKLIGVVYVVLGIVDFMFAIILMGIVMLALGFGGSMLADWISARKANKQ